MSASTSSAGSNSTRIKELPSSERPRERLRMLGAQSLSTTELIATLLGSGHQGMSAVACAHVVFEYCGGSLGRLASTPLAALTRIRGVGWRGPPRFRPHWSWGGAWLASAEAGLPMRGPQDVAAAFAPRLQDAPVEEFHVAILDAQHRLERDVLITRGLLNSSLVHPREVFREAIAERAAAVILVHNHPSGDPTPSAEDRAVTEQLVAAGRLLDIPVHDHVIVGRGRYVSFAESGLL